MESPARAAQTANATPIAANVTRDEKICPSTNPTTPSTMSIRALTPKPLSTHKRRYYHRTSSVSSSSLSPSPSTSQAQAQAQAQAQTQAQAQAQTQAQAQAQAQAQSQTQKQAQAQAQAQSQAQAQAQHGIMSAKLHRQPISAPFYSLTAPLTAATTQQPLDIMAYPGTQQLVGLGGTLQMGDAATLEQLRMQHITLLNVIKNHDHDMPVKNHHHQQQQQPQVLQNQHVAAHHPVQQHVQQQITQQSYHQQLQQLQRHQQPINLHNVSIILQV